MSNDLHGASCVRDNREPASLVFYTVGFQVGFLIEASPAREGYRAMQEAWSPCRHSWA